MSIQNIPDKDLDNFFRRSAEDAQIPFDESSWEKMEEKLDKNDRRRRPFIFLFPLLTGIVVATLFLLKTHSPYEIQEKNLSDQVKKESPEVNQNATLAKPVAEKENDIAPKAVTQKAAKKNSTNKNTREIAISDASENTSGESTLTPLALHTSSVIPSGENETFNSPRTEKPLINKSEQGTQQQDSLFDPAYNPEITNKASNSKGSIINLSAFPAKNELLSNSKATRSENSLSVKVEKKHKATKGDSPIEKPENRGSEKNISNVEIASVQTGHSTGTDITEKTEIQTIEIDKIPHANSGDSLHFSKEPELLSGQIPLNPEINVSDQKKLIPDTISIKTDTTEEDRDTVLIGLPEEQKGDSKKKDKEHGYQKFSTGLSVSPDFSSVGFFNFGTPGFAAGVFSEFYFSKNVGLYIGLFHTSKVYSSTYEGYHEDESYWAYKNYTEKIEGSCSVIDIPLNLRIKVLNRPASSVFISGGLSSYFMYEQKYSFVYSNDYYPTRTWENKDSKNYFLGVLNFSAGFEKIIAGPLAIQAEPFLKVPLKNVGDGKIRLVTTGIYLSVKYIIK